MLTGLRTLSTAVAGKGRASSAGVKQLLKEVQGDHGCVGLKNGWFQPVCSRRAS